MPKTASTLSQRVHDPNSIRSDALGAVANECRGRGHGCNGCGCAVGDRATLTPPNFGLEFRTPRDQTRQAFRVLPPPLQARGGDRGTLGEDIPHGDPRF